MKPSQTEIRLSGLGGQGVILAGMIIGRAASIYADKHATLIQSFGPEARGSACSAELIVADKSVLYPYVKKAKILVALSNEGYHKYRPLLADDGLLLVEEDLVRLDPHETCKVFKCPATRLAEELGRKIVLNIAMVGFFAAVTKLVDREAFAKSVEASVPEHMKDLNLKAFHKGYEWGLTLV
jgi:2-oxoglutarate ferredoxin oxidoreductase subunit gamma